MYSVNNSLIELVEREHGELMNLRGQTTLI